MSESADRYQQIVQALAQMVWTCDAAGVCDFLSPQWLAYTGVQTSVSLGNCWLDAVHPEDRERVVTAWQEAIASRTPLEIEARIRRGDGTYRWFSTRALPTLDESGQVSKWFGSTSDIHELHESKEQLREVLDYSLDASFRRNLQTDTYDYLSPVFGRISGYEQDLMESWSAEAILALVHPDDLPQVRRVFEESRSKGTRNRYEFEYRFKHKAGHYVWIRARFIVIRDADWRALARVGSLANISEIKEAEEATRASEQRFRSMIYSSPVPCALNDDEQNILYVNPAFVHTFGWNLQDIPTLSDWWPRAYPDAGYSDQVAGMWQARLEQAKAHGRPFEPMEVQVHAKDGSVRTVVASAAPLADAFSGVHLVTLIDITARKLAEQRLEESQARLNLAMDQAQLVYWELDFATNTFTFNDRFYALYGTTAEREGGYRMPAEVYAREFLPPEERSVIADCAVRRLGGDVGEYQLEHRVRRRDGELRDIIVRVSAVRSFSGGTVVSHGSTQDITERKRAAADLAKLEAQLHQAQKMEAVGTLAGGIAHDFNNILGAIIGNVTLAAEDLGPAHPARVSLDQIDKSSRRAADLVKQLLAISRPAKLERQVVDLPTVIHQDAALIRAMLPAGVEMTVAVDEEVPAILAHPTELHQVLLNLCTNAGHAMASGAGLLRLMLTGVTRDAGTGGHPSGLEPGRYARLSIHDTGTGMDAATLDRIFDPFFTTKEVGQGTGLGLTMVHRIMTSLRGAVTVASEVGKGTTVTLYFPETVATSAHPVVNAPAEVSRGRGQHVLFLDDEQALVDLGTRILSRGGYRVSGYSRVEDALTAFRADPAAVDVVVVDYHMPGATGIAVAQQLMAMHPDLPIVLASGRVTEAMEIEAAAVGIAEVLPKPYSAAELNQIIGTVCRTPTT